MFAAIRSEKRNLYHGISSWIIPRRIRRRTDKKNRSHLFSLSWSDRRPRGRRYEYFNVEQFLFTIFSFHFFVILSALFRLRAQELTEAYPKWISSWNLNWLIFAVATAIFYHYTITICFSLIIIKNFLCRDVPPSSKITLLSIQYIKKSNKNSTLQTYKPLSTNLADRTLDRTLVKQKGLGNYPAVVYLSKTTTLCINFRKLFTNIRNNNLTEPRRATRSPQNLHHRYVESRVLFRVEAFV